MALLTDYELVAGTYEEFVIGYKEQIFFVTHRLRRLLFIFNFFARNKCFFLSKVVAEIYYWLKGKNLFFLKTRIIR